MKIVRDWNQSRNNFAKQQHVMWINADDESMIDHAFVRYSFIRSVLQSQMPYACKRRRNTNKFITQYAIQTNRHTFCNRSDSSINDFSDDHPKAGVTRMHISGSEWALSRKYFYSFLVWLTNCWMDIMSVYN